MSSWEKHLRNFVACLEEYLPPFARRGVAALAAKWMARSAKSDPELDRLGMILSYLPAPAMPFNLPVQIRRRISQERRKLQRASGVTGATFAWRWRNRLEPFAVPAAVGLLSAVLIFGSFIRVFEVPVQASTADVPLPLRTSPRLRTNAFLETNNGIECMVVRIVIDESGRVADFQILKGKQTPEQVRNLEYLMVFTRFAPATLFGIPTTDTLTLALRDGEMKGLSL